MKHTELDNDILQVMWDRWLVESFYKRSRQPMSSNVHLFFRDHGLHSDNILEFNMCLRTPRYAHHWKTSVGRFICGYLPTIAEVLWKHDISKLNELSLAVNKLKSTTRRTPADVEKTQRESRERDDVTRDLKKARLERNLTQEWFVKYRRSNQWGTVK